MKILVDTNVLLRIGNAAHADHGIARESVERLQAAGHGLMIVPQVLYEYWVVSTRPVSVNGFGMTSQDALAMINQLESLFPLLLDERGIFSKWKSLVTNHSVVGKGSHDARLVAAMIRHGLSDILTFNSGDFARFSMIKAHTPASVLSDDPKVL